LELTDLFAVSVPAGGSALVAILTVTALAAPGPMAWKADLTVGIENDLLYAGSEAFFEAVPDLGGTHVVNLVPEPATLALLVIGGLVTLRRRR